MENVTECESSLNSVLLGAVCLVNKNRVSEWSYGFVT
jgi:hypothetical protein